jgi:hypothetical protein
VTVRTSKRRRELAPRWSDVPEREQGDIVDVLLFGRQGAKARIVDVERGLEVLETGEPRWSASREESEKAKRLRWRRQLASCRRNLVQAADKMAAAELLGWLAEGLRKRLVAAWSRIEALEAKP